MKVVLKNDGDFVAEIDLHWKDNRLQQNTTYIFFSSIEISDWTVHHRSDTRLNYKHNDVTGQKYSKSLCLLWDPTHINIITMELQQ